MDAGTSIVARRETAAYSFGTTPLDAGMMAVMGVHPPG